MDIKLLILGQVKGVVLYARLPYRQVYTVASKLWHILAAFYEFWETIKTAFSVCHCICDVTRLQTLACLRYVSEFRYRIYSRITRSRV